MDTPAVDLFGNEHPVTEGAKAVFVATLFDAAAERLAIASGRPVSQERLEVMHGGSPDAPR